MGRHLGLPFVWLLVVSGAGACRGVGRPSTPPQAAGAPDVPAPGPASAPDGGAGALDAPASAPASDAAAGTGPATAPSGPPALVDDFGAPWTGPVAVATGPGGLVAFGAGRRVVLWDMAARRSVGEIGLADDGPKWQGVWARTVESLGFIPGDRLAIGAGGEIEVVRLRDTAARQLLDEREVSVRVIEGTADGMVVGFGSGRVVRFAGDPLAVRASWLLPDGSEDLPQSLAVDGERVFATSYGHAYALGRAGVLRLPLPPDIGDRDHVSAAVSGNLELVVAAGKTRLFRFSLETLTSTATISSDMASPVEYPLVIECDATARLCYWSRDTQREVWRDDFSERVAAVEFPGWVDPRTGRAVGPWVRTSRTDGSSGEGPGTPLYQVVERVDGPPRPMGVRASSLRHVAWSSREGEIILEAGGVFVLRLSDLTITPLPDTGSPIAVGSDGRILGVGPYSEIVVWSPELVEERRIYPRGCDHERIVRLEAQPGDEAREERLELEDRCNDFSPSLLAPAPSSSFVAMDSGGDELWVLDYARGRWTEHYGDLWRLVNHRRLDGLLWPATGDELFVVGTGQHFLVRRGSRGAEPSDLGDIVAAMASDGQGTFALSTDEGVLHFRTGTAETTLRLPFTPSAILAGPDAQWVAVGGRDAALVANGTVVARYRVGRSEGRSDVCWSGPQPVLATRDDAGGLLLTRLRDGRQLSIALVPHEGRLFAIARSDAAFSAPPEVRELVHLRLGATDLLAPTASAASVLEPALVESFLREPDPGQSSGGVAGAASGGLAP